MVPNLFIAISSPNSKFLGSFKTSLFKCVQKCYPCSNDFKLKPILQSLCPKDYSKRLWRNRTFGELVDTGLNGSQHTKLSIHGCSMVHMSGVAAMCDGSKLALHLWFNSVVVADDCVARGGPHGGAVTQLGTKSGMETNLGWMERITNVFRKKFLKF